MGFEGLLGNRRLKENISRSIRQGHIAHFYLLCGPEGSGRHTLAKLLSAAILCRGEAKPCGECPACRKVFSNTHPDVITVDDPEKKTVPVDLIRQARADMYIQPNEATHKIYLFPRAQDMGIPGQNALLKVLEEPPAYGVFILLTDNPEKLLPTVRSRCVLLRMESLEKSVMEATLRQRFPQASQEAIDAAISRSGGFLGQALALLQEGADFPSQTIAFAKAYAQGDSLELARVLIPLEKAKRDALLPLLEQWRILLESALACRSGGSAISDYAGEIARKRPARDLFTAITALSRAIEYTQGNVSPAAVCGWLSWELR